MFRDSINVVARCKKDEVLTILRENRKKHIALVEEAKKGYLKDARAAVAEKLESLEKGKITGLSFDLNLPEDHTKSYDTVIEMLEMSDGEYVELTAQDFKQFVKDNWEWRNMFIMSNAKYSAGTQALGGFS